MAAENVWASGKVLVVYYSLSGNTARVARDLARRAQADVESLQDLEHGVGFFGYVKAALDAFRGKSATLGNLTSDPRRYSLVIIGTPVWVGRMTPAVRAYLTRFSRDLPRVGLFGYFRQHRCRHHRSRDRAGTRTQSRGTGRLQRAGTRRSARLRCEVERVSRLAESDPGDEDAGERLRLLSLIPGCQALMMSRPVTRAPDRAESMRDSRRAC